MKRKARKPIRKRNRRASQKSRVAKNRKRETKRRRRSRQQRLSIPRSQQQSGAHRKALAVLGRMRRSAFVTE